jgi:Polyketide cyclase / dehydrase and lipid transport
VSHFGRLGHNRGVRQHEFSFEIDATPEEVWRALHPPLAHLPDGERRVIEHGDVRIEIVHPGDENGLGLVRLCRFRVPRYLLSGGVGRSWEVITESRPPEFSRYEAVGKPLWSRATGWHRVEHLEGGRTLVSFGETYEAFNPLARRFLEARVHRFISRDNDIVIRQAVEHGVSAQRRKAARG